jgi:hypothetical protein
MLENASMDCKAVLTSQRFVALHERRWNTLGPIFFFVALFIPKKMVFEIDLQDLAAVSEVENEPNTLVLRTSDNDEFKIRLNGLKDTFGKGTRSAWIEKIRDARQAAFPDAEVPDAYTEARL